MTRMPLAATAAIVSLAGFVVPTAAVGAERGAAADVGTTLAIGDAEPPYPAIAGLVALLAALGLVVVLVRRRRAPELVA